DAGGRRRLACVDGDADRWLPLRSGTVRGRRRAGRSRRGQLLDLLTESVPALDRAARGVPHRRGRGPPRDVPLRHRSGPAPVLLPLRRREFLRPALAPRRHRRQRALPRRGGRGEPPAPPVRRAELGAVCRRAPGCGTGRRGVMSVRAALVLGLFLLLAALVHGGLYAPGHDFVMNSFTGWFQFVSTEDEEYDDEQGG